MKRLFPLSLLVLAFAACQQPAPDPAYTAWKQQQSADSTRRAAIAATLDDYAKAVDSADVVKLYAAKAVSRFHNSDYKVEGAPAIAAWASSNHRSFPDLKFRETARYFAGDSVAIVEGRVTGTFSGAPMQMGGKTTKPNGKRMDVPMLVILTFDDQGKIVDEKTYWDDMSFYTQLAIKP